MSTRDQLAEAVSRAVATVAERDGARPRGRSGRRSISSARPAGSTATGRPTSPWSRPSGPGPTPGPWPPSLVEALDGRPARPRRLDRDRRPGLHQLPARRRLAARRPGRAARARARTATPGPTWATASGSRSSSSRPIPTGPIHVGNGWWGSYGDALARVLARAGYQVSREYYVNDTGGQIRTLGESLLARRPRGGGARGRLPGRVRDRAGRHLRRARRRDGRRPVGGRPDPRAHPGHPGLGGHRLRRVVQPGLHRGERRGRRDHRPAGRQGPGLRAGRRHLVPGHRARGQPRPGAAQVERRRHLPGRRPRLPPRQVPRPGLRPGHRRVRRRPPRPGGQPDGRGRGARRRPRAASRSSSARWSRWWTATRR